MASKFGLGRGLADIQMAQGALPDISILTGGERVVIKQIPLAQIGANPDQPRKTFRDAELNDLAASIKEKGVLQPILLRAVAGRPYNYEIVAGERRFRASKLAGLTEIPAVVKKLDDNNAMEIALIENVQRENLDPVEEAAAYKNLIEKCNYEMDDVSRLIGKSASYIRNSMRILELPESVRLMVSNGELSASHARTIAVAENPEKLAQEIVNKKMSVADTSALVKNTKRTGKARQFVSKTIAAADIKRMENDIQKSLNVSAKILEKRGGAGQIVLKFNTRVEMNELISKLIK